MNTFHVHPMRIITLLILLALRSLPAQHSVLSSSITAASRGLGQTGICEWNPTSGLMNPALLAFLELPNFGLEAQNYYLIKGLYTYGLHASVPKNSNSGFGITVTSDGSEDLRDWLFSFCYGHKLGLRSGIGVSFDYFYTQTPESNDLHHIGIDLGLQTQLSNVLILGFYARNPIPIKSKSADQYPYLIKTGMNYKVYEQLNIIVEIQKHGKQNTSFHIGIQYSPSTAIALYCGVNTLGPDLSFGAKYKVRSTLCLTSAIESNTTLGYNSSFGINYSFN